MRPTLALLVALSSLACSKDERPPTNSDADATVDAPRVDAVADTAPNDVTSNDITSNDVANDGSVAPVDAVSDVTPSRLRVLFVGNSYTYVNDLPSVVAAISRASRGPAIEATTVAVGGATLRSHWETNDAPARITTAPWEAVVLQGQSVEPALNYDEFRTYGLRFGMLANTYRARPVFYATWPRRAGDAVYAESWSGGTPTSFNDRLDLAYSRVAMMTSGTVAHVGNAWMASLSAHPEINLYADDGSHPSAAGTWLAACVIYRALTGSLPDASADDAAMGITATEARSLRDTAAMQTP